MFLLIYINKQNYYVNSLIIILKLCNIFFLVHRVARDNRSWYIIGILLYVPMV